MLTIENQFKTHLSKLQELRNDNPYISIRSLYPQFCHHMHITLPQFYTLCKKYGIKKRLLENPLNGIETRHPNEKASIERRYKRYVARGGDDYEPEIKQERKDFVRKREVFAKLYIPYMQKNPLATYDDIKRDICQRTTPVGQPERLLGLKADHKHLKDYKLAKRVMHIIMHDILLPTEKHLRRLCDSEGWPQFKARKKKRYQEHLPMVRSLLFTGSAKKDILQYFWDQKILMNDWDIYYWLKTNDL